MKRAGIPVAVGPVEADWVVDAIRRGGGEPVGLGQEPIRLGQEPAGLRQEPAGLRQEPVGLIWTDGGAVRELRDVLRAYPEISWVQLPTAGGEVKAGDGALDHRRQWASADGGSCEAGARKRRPRPGGTR